NSVVSACTTSSRACRRRPARCAGRRPSSASTPRRYCRASAWMARGWPSSPRKGSCDVARSPRSAALALAAVRSGGARALHRGGRPPPVAGGPRPPAGATQRARALAPMAARQVGRGGADVIVRINRPWHHAFRDIEAVVGGAVMGLMCPKVESPEHLNVIAELLDTVEVARGLPAGHTKLIALIETAGAYFRVADIAHANPRLIALSLGAEDFAASVAMEPVGEALEGPKQTVIIAARAA